MEDEKIFITDNLSLCAYLEINKLKPAGTEIGVGKNGVYKGFFKFYDPDGIGKDLEIDFRFSNEKRYKDIGYYYRNELEKLRPAIAEANQKRLKQIKEKNKQL